MEAIKTGEFINWLKKKFSQLNGESITKLQRYEINILVRKATQNANESKVMLGKYVEDSSTSYHIRAGEDHAFFQLDDKLWKEMYEKVNGDLDELWKVNQQFIDEQFKKRKEFYLSHQPVNDISFYAREIRYIKKELKGKIIKINETL